MTTYDDWKADIANQYGSAPEGEPEELEDDEASTESPSLALAQEILSIDASLSALSGDDYTIALYRLKKLACELANSIVETRDDAKWTRAELARVAARPPRHLRLLVPMTCSACGHEFLADSTSLRPEGCPECGEVP